MAKQYKLDLFHLLKHIDKKDTEFYSSLSEEEKKGFIPLITLRWLSGTRQERQIIFLNELVNRFVFPFDKHHRELLYKLLTICTTGKISRYHWNKVQSKKTSSAPTAVSIIKEYFKYNHQHAVDALPLLSNDDIMGYATELGLQPDVISKLKRELKARQSELLEFDDE